MTICLRPDAGSCLSFQSELCPCCAFGAPQEQVTVVVREGETVLIQSALGLDRVFRLNEAR